MKKLFTILLILILCVTTTATAQIKNSIVLDLSTFRTVQKGALTGVNVDPIGVDHSRQACARLKIFFHKMTREQLAQLDAIFPSGTIEKTKIKVADYENVLILEMTAKPQVVFYLKHPTFGTSNEVTLSLEGNKEYQLEATLNQTYSIVVESNVVGADVYVDGEFKGQTNNDFRCTIADIMNGGHKLTVVFDNVSREQNIEVNRNSISFRQNLDLVSITPQHVSFEVAPVDADAKLEIDGVFFVPISYNGITNLSLAPGTHRYTVSAPKYYNHTGEFVVRNIPVKVPRITLKPTFGVLSIGGNLLSNASIFIDNKLIENNGAINHLELSSGTHTVNIELNRYNTYETTVELAEGENKHIEVELEPKFAKVTIKASSPDVGIWLDDKFVGSGSYTAELDFGNYKVKASKAAHTSTYKSFYVKDAIPMNVELDAPLPILGSVYVSSNPAKADIYVDNMRTRQQTPSMIQNLKLGNHRITVKKNGYTEVSQFVNVTKDNVEKVALQLSSSYKPKNNNNYKTSNRDKVPNNSSVNKNGSLYEQSIDAKYSIYLTPSTKVHQFGVSYIGGIRFNDKRFFGLGIGIEHIRDNIDNNQVLANYMEQEVPALSLGSYSVPIFIHMRRYMGTYKRIFLGFSIGGKFFGFDNFTHSGVQYKYQTRAMFSDLSLGVNIRKFYFSIGASFHSLPVVDWYSNTQLDLVSDLCLGANLSIGFTF